MERAQASEVRGPAGFYGRFRLKLDAKGRLTLPSIHRRSLGGDEETWLVLRRGAEPYVQVVPMATWDEVVRSRRSRSGAEGIEKQWQRRREYGSVDTVGLDPKGRFTVPQELLEHAKAGREVLVLGVGRHIEIWDPETYFALESQHQAASTEIDDLLFD